MWKGVRLFSILKIFYSCSLIGCVCLFANFSFAATPHYLILHSYSPAYEWTAAIDDGIYSTLDSMPHSPLLSVEYLDTKRVFSKEYFDTFRHYINTKYRGVEFDGIAIFDDYALKFFKTLDKNKFGNLPTIAVGINTPNQTLESMTSQGLVQYEHVEIEKNIQVIHSIQSSLKNLYVVTDYSYTSSQIMPRIMDELTLFPDTNVIEIRDIPLQEVTEILAQVDSNDAVLLGLYNPELESNVYYSNHEIVSKLAKNSVAPVFVCWEYNIHSGVLGGVVTHSYDFGVFALQMLNAMAHRSFSNLSAVDITPRPIFDYAVIEKFNIDTDLLPKRSSFLNEPTYLIVQHWRIAVSIVIIIATLLVILFIQSISIRRKRILNKRNAQIMQLQEHTLTAQKGFIHVLGDAIESRSGETSNHVNRVAELSSRLGALYGLDKHDCSLLKLVSPMHDVGKIGVSESILEKPGKLTDNEWSTMKTHTTIGYKLLVSGEGEIMRLAAIIALQHHERWDGQGYPNQLKGDKTHIYARITGVVDVFDALLSKRCYKEAWPVVQVVELLEREKGKQFDPTLTQLLLDHIDVFLALRQTYPD